MNNLLLYTLPQDIQSRDLTEPADDCGNVNSVAVNDANLYWDIIITTPLMGGEFIAGTYPKDIFTLSQVEKIAVRAIGMEVLYISDGFLPMAHLEPAWDDGYNKF